MNRKIIKNKIIGSERGQIFLLSIVALGVVVFTVLAVITGAQLSYLNSTYSINAEKSTALAEAGIDKAIAALNKSGGNYNGEAETAFGDGSYSVTITNKDSATKIIESIGYLPEKNGSKVRRKIEVQVSKGVGVSFVYGLQVGGGGIEMGNGSTLNGSIYSNYNISGGNDSVINGDVFVAGGTDAVADQQQDCIGANCQDYIFGKNEGGQARQDVAQSFQPAQNGVLNKISLRLKKVGLPANPTIKIMTDSSGKPNKNGVLVTTTLSADLVTTQYGFIEVAFASSPNLSEDHTYWIMIHSAGLDNSNYWVWSNDLALGYGNGVPKWSSDWQAGNPVWTGISGDLGFKTFMGGSVTSINLGSGSQINGNVHANTISGQMTIQKNAYYQTIGSQVIVSGTKFPDSTNPAPSTFPVSDANIMDWKNAAELAGIQTGNITSCVSTLGPGKIVGNVSLGNSCNVKVIAPVWITGNLSTGNTTKFTLDTSFGIASGMIIVDGTTSFGNGVDLLGSGTAGSYLMLLSTYNSIVNDNEAINSGNSAISGIIYAPYGKVELANGASFKEITAWKIDLGNTATLNYESGLASTFFTSGPSGAYSLIKGTYQIK